MDTTNFRQDVKDRLARVIKPARLGNDLYRLMLREVDSAFGFYKRGNTFDHVGCVKELRIFVSEHFSGREAKETGDRELLEAQRLYLARRARVEAKAIKPNGVRGFLTRSRVFAAGLLAARRKQTLEADVPLD